MTELKTNEIYKHGDSCDVYSHSKQKWFRAEIIETIIATRGREVTVRYKYQTKYIKKRLSVNSKDIRPFQIEHHEDIVKCICNEPMKWIDAQSYSKFLDTSRAEYESKDKNVETKDSIANAQKEKVDEKIDKLSCSVDEHDTDSKQTEEQPTVNIISNPTDEKIDNSDRSDADSVLTEEHKDWSCVKCTYLNKYHRRTCEMCQNHTSKQPAMKIVSNWQCTICGAQNDCDLLNCNACTYSRENALLDIEKQNKFITNDTGSISCAACAYLFLKDDSLFYCPFGFTPKHNTGYGICRSCALNEEDEPIKNELNEAIVDTNNETKGNDVDEHHIAKQVSDIPFAEGSARYAYLGVWKTGPKKGTQCVLKRYKNRSYDFKDFDPDVKCCELAAVLVKEWNSMNLIGKKYEIIIPIIAQKGSFGWELSLLLVILLKLGSEDAKRLLGELESKQENDIEMGEVVMIEDYLKGDFIKWNSNSGWMGEPDLSVQAFCHWTYHYSKGQYLFCDAQGVKRAQKYILTDPCILSNTKQGKVYGITDMGRDYLLNWFRQHECNKFCDKNWLEPSVTELHCVPQSVRRRTTKASSYNVSKIIPTELMNNIRSVSYMKSNTVVANEECLESKSCNKYDNPEWSKYDRYLSWQNGETIIMCSKVIREKTFSSLKRIMLLSSFEKLYLIDENNRKRPEGEYTKFTIKKTVVTSKWKMILYVDNNKIYFRCEYEAKKWKELIDKTMELNI